MSATDTKPTDQHAVDPAVVRERTDGAGRAWLDEACAAVVADRTALATRFPAAGRQVGRGPLDPAAAADDLHAWTLDDAARTLLLLAVDRVGVDELAALYRHGDAAERRGVLRALPHLHLGDVALPLLDDALRTNDLRLVAAAVGPYAATHLDEHGFTHAVLKCVFVGVPLAGVDGLARRSTPELSRMLAAYAHERVAAGRDVPDEVWPLVLANPPRAELDAIRAEAHHDDPDRAAAAERALARLDKEQR